MEGSGYGKPPPSPRTPLHLAVRPRIGRRQNRTTFAADSTSSAPGLILRSLAGVRTQGAFSVVMVVVPAIVCDCHQETLRKHG